MRAVVIAEPGGPEVLEVREVPDPVPAEGEVVITTVAAGVNRADLSQRLGFYPPPPGAPPYPGLECSGHVTAIGAGVTGWQVGDAACALLAGGGYAEQVAVPAGQLLPIPAGVSLRDAAALPEVACTVYANIVMYGHIAPGETLLVHGGASGIGTMAIQVGRALGATVACTAGSASKLARCRELGAELTVNYREQDFAAAVLDFTGGRGADIILDIVGAAYLEPNVTALATGGRSLGRDRDAGRRSEGRSPRPWPAHSQARYRARLDAAVQAAGRQGGRRLRRAPRAVAADRIRARQARHRDHPAAGGGTRCAPPHGRRRARGQDLAGNGGRCCGTLGRRSGGEPAPRLCASAVPPAN